ncbi:hypothetical protein ABBQ38_003447 [Trebouxia sp. C0009 RCD-2024]
MRPAIAVCTPSQYVVTCQKVSLSNPGRQHRPHRCQITQARPQLQRLRAVPSDKHSADENEDFEGLLPEEDWTVPGGYQDSLSSNTELGRAVQSACDELDNLSALEKESLTKASKLLQKLGYKGDIFQNAPASTDGDRDEQDRA